jgi:hypothetical protein
MGIAAGYEQRGNRHLVFTTMKVSPDKKSAAYKRFANPATGNQKLAAPLGKNPEIISPKLIERYKGMVVCDHAEKCGNQECKHGWPHHPDTCTGHTGGMKGCSYFAESSCKSFAELAAARNRALLKGKSNPRRVHPIINGICPNCNTKFPVTDQSRIRCPACGKSLKVPKQNPAANKAYGFWACHGNYHTGKGHPERVLTYFYEESPDLHGKNLPVCPVCKSRRNVQPIHYKRPRVVTGSAATGNPMPAGNLGGASHYREGPGGRVYTTFGDKFQRIRYKGEAYNLELATHSRNEAKLRVTPSGFIKKWYSWWLVYHKDTSGVGNPVSQVPTQSVPQIYTVGKIVEYSWGYEQTNIDYYMIVKRSGPWMWLQPMTTTNIKDTGFMSGTCMPGVVKPGAPILRRKVHVWQDREHGVAIEKFGWGSLWDGRPSHWSNYA